MRNLLEKKNAIVYGAGGALGSAIARAFAQEGANVFLAGRHRSRVEAVAHAIREVGGAAEAAQVDALDERAVEEHADAVEGRAGGVDVSANAIGIPQDGVQGLPLAELSAESFLRPVTAYARSNFLTARAAARRMIPRRSGVILTLTATPARSASPHVGGMAPAWAALEALARSLATELGPHQIRVVCLRSNAIPETRTIEEVFALHEKAAGLRAGEFRALIEGATQLRRLPTLAEVASAAAFAASDRASAMTGAVVNLSCGSIVD
jgi:NAD(P)-dependent dehydrogenase (short-subunit alcohol dehydrogenase family)